MKQFTIRVRFLCLIFTLGCLPLCISAQGNGNGNAFGLTGSVPGAAHANFRARPMQEDSVAATGGLPYHCQLKFELPDSTEVAAIHLAITRPGNSGQIIQRRIPLIARSRRYQNIGVIRQGNTVWLDFGLLRGNPNYTASIQLEDGAGQVSAATAVLAQ
jgi:hypothetical protein